VYVLAASADGDQKATFEVGGKSVELNIQDWGGFVGQWDDRQWSSKDTSHDDYGEMMGIKPGYIKRADVAWYCSHHHTAAGANVAYRYSYLFAYPIDLPAGTKSIKLPDNDKIRILAISVAEENPEVKPAQPLYDCYLRRGLRARQSVGRNRKNNLLLFRSGRTKTLYSSCNAFILIWSVLCAAAWAQTAPSRQNADPVRKQSSVASRFRSSKTSVIKRD